jgi:hypothetical protein
MPAFVVSVLAVLGDDLMKSRRKSLKTPPSNSMVVSALVDEGQKTVAVPAVSLLFETVLTS